MNQVLCAQCIPCPSHFSCEPLYQACLWYIDAYPCWDLPLNIGRRLAHYEYSESAPQNLTVQMLEGEGTKACMCRLEVSVVHCRCASAVAATLIDSLQILCIEVELFWNVCSCAGKAITSLTAKLDARPKDGPLTDYYIWFAWLHCIFAWLLRLHTASCSLIISPQERGVVLYASQGYGIWMHRRMHLISIAKLWSVLGFVYDWLLALAACVCLWNTTYIAREYEHHQACPFDRSSHTIWVYCGYQKGMALLVSFQGRVHAEH